jgi:type IV pilus assembly protein PilP
MKLATHLLFLSCALLPIGCDDEVIQSSPPPPRKAAAAAADAVADAGVTLPAPDFQEAEFVETERSRDPFRSFARTFAEEARGSVRSQREVVLDQYSIDELRLIGIITRIHPAKAMLVDPTGVGHVVQRGQFVGRPEIVQAGTLGASGQEINWRIDRIREGDVVLVREDPKNPDVPSATRVIPLRSDSSETGTTE